MASSNNQKMRILLILLMASLVYGENVEKKDKILSGKQANDNLNLELQLKRVNKSVVKSIKTKYGDIYDCVDIKKQPAFNHPLLRNHTIQMKPSSLPVGLINKEVLESKPSKIRVKTKCPLGTVLIRRTEEEDMVKPKSEGGKFSRNSHQLTANSGYQFADFQLRARDTKFYGGRIHIGVDNPKTLADEFSAAVLWVQNGTGSQLNSIQAGWMVNLQIYGDNRTRIFAYWTRDGAQRTGCFNLRCPGFVQVSRKQTLGSFYKRYSVFGGQQYEDDFHVFKDAKSGNWWFAKYYEGGLENIGYWPSAILTSLRDSADMIAAGGVVYSPRNECTPQMGKGFQPKDNDEKWAGFARNLQFVDHTNKLKDPHPSELVVRVTDPTCYQAETKYSHLNSWKNSLLFGGPART